MTTGNNGIHHDFSGVQQFVQSTVITKDNPVIAGIDGFMNWLIHEGIPGAAGAARDFIGAAASKGISYVDNKMEALSSAVSPESPAIARSQQIESPIKTPEISQEVVASAKNAVMGMSASQGMHVANDAQVSPSHTPNVTGVGIGYGGMSV